MAEFKEKEKKLLDNIGLEKDKSETLEFELSELKVLEVEVYFQLLLIYTCSNITLSTYSIRRSRQPINN